MEISMRDIMYSVRRTALEVSLFSRHLPMFPLLTVRHSTYFAVYASTLVLPYVGSSHYLVQDWTRNGISRSHAVLMSFLEILVLQPHPVIVPHQASKIAFELFLATALIMDGGR